MAYLTDESGNRFLENGSLLVDCVPISRLGYGGYGVRRAGTFGGKGATAHSVNEITKLSPDGYGARLYGSFVSKASPDGPHTVGVITRLDGYGVRRYRNGAFAAKSQPPGVHPVGIISRLGLDGYGVRRYSSFAGKTSSTPVPHLVGIITRLGLDGYGVRRYGSFANKKHQGHGVGIPGGGRGHKHPRDWKPERGFSRKYFDEMLAADKAALAALNAAANRKRIEQQEALEQAAQAAQEALQAVQEQDTEVDLTPLTRALEAAVSAKNFATSLKRAQDAIEYANAIMAEEEEEAIMLLLLN